MRIGINALYLIPGGVGGTEIYLRHLLESFAEIDGDDEFFVFTNRETGGGVTPRHPRFATVPQPVRAVHRPARILWEQTVLPAECMRLRLDALLNPGFTAPAAPPCPQITVFHDLQHKRHPENFRWFELPFWRLLLWVSARRSQGLLAISEPTRDDLLRFYRLAPGKVAVAPLGVDPRFFALPRREADPPYLLAASTLHPHKNLDRLLRVFAPLRAEAPELRLVVTGVRGFAARQLEQLRAELGLDRAVEFTGWLPREELYQRFAGARAFVYPTRFEGFGLPVGEALAAGIPTACSNIEPVKSIAGDAAWLFPPDDPAAMAEALWRVLWDEAVRARLAAAGPARARQFSWRRTAEITLAALHRLQPLHHHLPRLRWE